MPAPDTDDRAPRGTGPRTPALPPHPGGRPAGPAPADRAATTGPARPAAHRYTGDDTAAPGPSPAHRHADDAAAPGAARSVEAGEWPTVRPPSTRAVTIRRVAAVLGLAYGYAVYAIATDVLARAEHLFAAVVVGGVLNVFGVVLLWLSASRTPVRVAPARGPAMGLATDRRAARKLLRSGGTPDGEQRRLLAVEVLADAPLPLVTGGVFVLLGPLVVAVVHDSGTFAWLGPVTAGLILLLLAGLGWRTWSAYAFHRAADRRHTVPRFAGSGTPWRPWP